MSSRRQSFLGITSLEFRHDAGKVKPLRPTPATVRRAPEPAGPGPGLMLPHVPIQARGNSDSEHLSPGRGLKQSWVLQSRSRLIEISWYV
eukprot:g14049.t1